MALWAIKKVQYIHDHCDRPLLPMSGMTHTRGHLLKFKRNFSRLDVRKNFFHRGSFHCQLLNNIDNTLAIEGFCFAFAYLTGHLRCIGSNDLSWHPIFTNFLFLMTPQRMSFALDKGRDCHFEYQSSVSIKGV